MDGLRHATRGVLHSVPDVDDGPGHDVAFSIRVIVPFVLLQSETAGRLIGSRCPEARSHRARTQTTHLTHGVAEGSTDLSEVGIASPSSRACRISSPTQVPPRRRPWARCRRGWSDILVGSVVVLPAAAAGRRPAGAGYRGAAGAVVLVLLSECEGLLSDRSDVPRGLDQGSAAGRVERERLAPEYPHEHAPCGRIVDRKSVV